jgi:hypothetical protein
VCLLQARLAPCSSHRRAIPVGGRDEHRGDAPGGFELELAIPNQDPTTYSMWLVEGRDVNLL